MTYKIYNNDCMNILPEIADKSIDLILCDLPYGTTDNSWDKVIPMKPLWNQYNRIIKDHGCILLFGQEPFSSRLRLSAPKSCKFRYDWIYHKSTPVGFLNANKMPLRAHENISVFYKHLPTYNPQKRYGFKNYSKKQHAATTNYKIKCKRKLTIVTDGSRFPIDVLCFANADKKNIYHPTQKPLKLIEYLVKTYTQPGFTVLDNCMGSGQTGIASLKQKCNFIGIEKEKKYYDIAKKRIEGLSNG